MLKSIFRHITAAALVMAVLISVCAGALAAFSQAEARAALLVDFESGEVLYSQNADTPFPPASTAKIMTALLVVEAVERGEAGTDDAVYISQEAVDSVPYDASSMDDPVKVGEHIQLIDMLYAVMLSSDCYACEAVAEHIAGGTDAFVDQMNTRARELGCEDTNFTNSSGYPDEEMYSTATALYKITAAALRYDLFKEVVSTTRYTVAETDMSEPRELFNTNLLLIDPETLPEDSDNSFVTGYLAKYDYHYKYAFGVKTGSSTSSGACLVAAAEKDGHTLISVVLGVFNTSPDDEEDDESDGAASPVVLKQYRDTIELFESGFELLEERERIAEQERERERQEAQRAAETEQERLKPDTDSVDGDAVTESIFGSAVNKYIIAAIMLALIVAVVTAAVSGTRRKR